MPLDLHVPQFHITEEYDKLVEQKDFQVCVLFDDGSAPYFWYPQYDPEQLSTRERLAMIRMLKDAVEEYTRWLLTHQMPPTVLSAGGPNDGHDGTGDLDPTPTPEGGIVAQGDAHGETEARYEEETAAERSLGFFQSLGRALDRRDRDNAQAEGG